jgi:integrase
MAGKRAHGEGMIRHRADGRWESSIMVRGERKYFYGHTQKEVKEKLNQAKEDARKGIPINPSKTTFEEWLLTWVEQYAKPNISPTTYDSYKYLIKDHIAPKLGQEIVNQLQPEQIQKFYTEKLRQKVTRHTKTGPVETKKTLSVALVHKMHVIINSSLSQAMREGKIYRNPNQLTKPPKVERQEAKYLTKEQMDVFFEKISGDRWFTAFVFGLATGIRRGELAALKWSRIDLKNGLFHVREGIVRVRPEPGKTKLLSRRPKSKRSRRTIPLHPDIVALMTQWKELQDIEKRNFESEAENKPEDEKTKFNEEGYVFTWPDGRKISPDHWTHHFKNLAVKNGLTDIHLHNLRHSFATWLLQDGENIKTVQELLGHATAAFMLDTYAHAIPEVKRAAANKMGSMLEGIINDKNNKKP